MSLDSSRKWSKFPIRDALWWKTIGSGKGGSPKHIVRPAGLLSWDCCQSCNKPHVFYNMANNDKSLVDLGVCWFRIIRFSLIICRTVRLVCKQRCGWWPYLQQNPRNWRFINSTAIIMYTVQTHTPDITLQLVLFCEPMQEKCRCGISSPNPLWSMNRTLSIFIGQEPREIV